MATSDNWLWIPIINLDRPATDGNGLQVDGTRWIGRTASQRPGVVGVCQFPGLAVGAAVISYHGLMLDGGYMIDGQDASEHYVWQNGAWTLAHDMHRYYGAYGAGNNDFGMYGYETQYVGTITLSSVNALANMTKNLILQEIANPTQTGEFSVNVTVTCVLDNPYEPGGDSDDGGGGGEFELENDPVPLPGLPNLNLCDTGFIKAYNPTLAELQAFQDWLWADNPFENIWRDVLGNPYDYIIGLTAIPTTPATGTAQRVILGNVQTPQNLTMRPITTQYKRHDFGTVDFKEYSKSFLDYAPFTKVTLYLPYVGYVSINPDYVNEKQVNVQYTIDTLTGSFAAFVVIDGKVLYTYTGAMGVNVPTTNQTYNNYLSGLLGRIGIIGGLAAAGVTGGLTAPMMAGGAVAASASYINAQKPTLEHGNAITGAPGAMGINYPYFIINRPMQSIPESIQKYSGFPSNLLKPLNDVKGFTKVEHAHLENISATDAEKAEIMAMLKEGVIF